MTLYSEPGEGTVVKLYLPALSEGIVATPHEHFSEDTRGNGERILVVEDDAELLKLVVRLLNELGYQTVQAKNGEEALRLLRNEHSFELLFSDVVLPGGMSGVELVDEARLSHPNLKVLFTSGYTGESMQTLRKLGYGLLEKPYATAELAHMLRQALVSISG